MNKYNPDYLCNDPKCKSREAIRDIIKEYIECYNKLEAKNKRLREALEWYADLSNKIKDNNCIIGIENKALEALKEKIK